MVKVYFLESNLNGLSCLYGLKDRKRLRVVTGVVNNALRTPRVVERDDLITCNLYSLLPELQLIDFAVGKCLERHTEQHRHQKKQ